ncbi:MAG: SBBP repeat-containing protein [Bacteroidetes bacterium]|nr:SBBP repeat-containing protein [Bacteroidota bacterium]
MFLRLLFILTFLSATATGQVRIIPNKGQWSKNFLYKADVVSGAVFFERQGLKYIFHDAKKLREIGHHHTTDSIVNFHALYVDFAGANSNPKTTEKNPSTEFYNYYLGKDESHWAAGVHAYSNIKYQGIYEGINLITDAEDEALKFTWEVAPKISPKKIILRIKGADKMLIAENGDLKITTSLGEVIEQTPVAWQYIKGKKKMVVCKYWQDSNEVGFVFPNGYDETQTLTIDPTVIFATFSGSKADNFGFTATYDSVGAGYSGGTVFNYPGDSFAFPTTAGAFQRKFGGGVVFNNSIGDYDRDCGILKYNATGTKLLWATYLGGKGNEEPHSMVVDGKNNLLVYGTTTSKNFAFTKTAYDTTYSDSTDIFITKFSGDSGKLMASTYLGGSHPDGLNGTINTGTKNKSPLSANYADIYRGEVISDAQSNVFVASSTASTDFPITANAYQKTYGGGGNDGCIFKMNSTLSKLVWSTYLGGKKYDAAFSLQTDSNGNIFTCGGTQSPYFFKDTLTYQKTIANDSADAFVCSISPDGSVVENATYLGTKYYDQSYFVQLDKKQNVYLYGQTGSPAFPVKNVKYYNPKAGQFITKFNHSLDTIIFSSVFGSPRAQVDISPSAFLVDDCGKIYVSGCRFCKGYGYPPILLLLWWHKKQRRACGWWHLPF